MASRQHELDQFSSKGKQLVIELKKIPDCDAQMMKKDMETLVDQWLDVSLILEDFHVSTCTFNCFGARMEAMAQKSKHYYNTCQSELLFYLDSVD